MTDGCGQTQCTNSTCASCNEFTYKSSSRNELAVQAVELFKQKAKLCEVQPSKIPKMPDEETNNDRPIASSSSSGYAVEAPELAASAVVPPNFFPSLSNICVPSSSKSTLKTNKNTTPRVSPDKSPSSEFSIRN